MFLKRVSPETDDFALKKISGCEGKKLVRISINANFITSVMRQSFQKYSENKGFAPPPTMSCDACFWKPKPFFLNAVKSL